MRRPQDRTEDASSDGDDPRFSPGQVVLGHYTIVRPLGRGGMGAVYLARDEVSGQQVAVKVLPAALARARDLRERFVEEARALASLDHPNIVPLVTFRAEGGPSRDEDLFLVMKYVAGESLDARIRRQGMLDPDEARRVLRLVLSALQYAHARGVVHRDVKPANVLLDGTVHSSASLEPGAAHEPRVYLVDFGISKKEQSSARLTQTGMLMGTPQYMSPEQISGQPVDGRSDLYAAGLLLFEMLCGRPPFDGKQTFEILKAHVEQPVPDVVEVRGGPVPDDLVAMIDLLLKKDPAERPKTADEALAYLDGARDLPRPRTPRPTPPRPTPPTAQLRPPEGYLKELSRPITGEMPMLGDEEDDLRAAFGSPWKKAAASLLVVATLCGGFAFAWREGLVSSWGVDSPLLERWLGPPAPTASSTGEAVEGGRYDDDMAAALQAIGADRPDDAVSALRRALEARPQAAEARSLLVDALLSAGRLEEAGVALASLRSDETMPEVVKERLLEQQATLARLRLAVQGGGMPKQQGRSRIPTPLILTVTATTNDAMKACFERHVLASAPQARGTVRIATTVTPDGRVSKASISSADVGGPAFHECLLDAARTWRFPSWRGEADTFTFSSEFNASR